MSETERVSSEQAGSPGWQDPVLRGRQGERLPKGGVDESRCRSGAVPAFLGCDSPGAVPCVTLGFLVRSS